MNREAIRVDVRKLEHPEPLEKIMQAIENTAVGDSILMIHRRRPIPLFPILQERGCSFSVREVAADHFEILITKDTQV